MDRFGWVGWTPLCKMMNIIKIKEQEEIVNVDDDKENFNEQINLQNDERDDRVGSFPTQN